jgi:signal transduction histidine kinase
MMKMYLPGEFNEKISGRGRQFNNPVLSRRVSATMIFRRLLQGMRTLRFRLIGWYLVLLLLALVIFSVYFFFQFRNLQQSQQDTTLEAAANSVRTLVDPGGRLGAKISFRNVPPSDPAMVDIYRKNIQVNLIDTDGTVVGTLGNSAGDMPVIGLPPLPGMSTISSDTGEWRVLSVPILVPGRVAGWIQVGLPAPVFDTELSGLFTPILFGTLLALLLAVLGGLFLANRALSPIDRVARTAQNISTRDLSQRINYQGPPDEIGRLAKTFDLMLDRLEKGFEQERRFTSDASHELRTPLTALKGRIEVALNRTRSPEEYRQTLDELNKEVDRLVKLSSSLLYLARLDQAENSWKPEILELSDLLDSIQDSMKVVAEQKNITLTADIPSEVPVEGNLDQLTRLFLNLLDNAIKYTPEGGEVTLKLEKGSKANRVLVTDNGPGIAAEHLPHLFKRFYRAQSDRASATGGAGLGLAIAYEIAKQHGGSLEISSQPGVGTTAKLSLPLVDSGKPALMP